MPLELRRLPAVRLVAFLALAAGCTVGPDYAPPAVEMPDAWQELSSGVVVDSTDLSRWWVTLGDPTLVELIREAMTGSLTLREAAARVEQARAQRYVAASALFPSLDVQSAVSRNRDSENLAVGIGGEDYSVFSVGLAASWELDLFGRVRRSVESAEADAQASEEDRRDVMVLLAAEVARTYIDLRTFQQRLAVTRGNLASQQEVVELTQTRMELGIASGLDVAQAEQVSASTRTLVPPLELAITEQLNRLSVLLGQQPGSLRTRLATSAPIPQPSATVAIGLPAELLRQRPDIRRAERSLAAQTARIGVAVGDLYPRFVLLGTFGFDASDAAKVFEGPSRAFSVGPSMVWNVFDTGRVRALIWSEEALTDQALARYQQQLLLALEEVENALAAYGETREQRLAVVDAVEASSTSLDLATTLYKDGAVDFQNVLDAQRSLLVLEEQLAITDGAVVQSVVRLYVALGGGWDPDEDRHLDEEALMTSGLWP